MNESRPRHDLNPAEFKALREAEFAHQRKLEAEAELRRLTDRLKTRYLAVPGTSEASFQAELPALLARYRTQQTVGDGDDTGSASASQPYSDPTQWGLKR